MPQVPPPEPPRSVWSGRTPTARKPERRKAEAPDSSWASRPNPEDVIDRLEQYFPDHDLDKPVIEASSGGTSPTAVDYPPVAQVPAVANVQAQDRRRHKKSIRIIAKERNSQHPRDIPTGSSFANNVARKRSTKLWDSRVEEVTPAQIQTVTCAEKVVIAIFKWVRGELIGKGNFGRVYLAMNVTTGEMIAVKQVEIPRTASDKNDTRQMNVVDALKLESETLKDLDHPNIVQYLGFEETATFLSIFLEYVPGGSIGGCLRKYGRFEENVTKSFTGQILAGLEYLHSKGILHRDMKADNILVETSGVCKISDFGISKRTDDINGQNVLTAMQGTVFWMAPEVVNTGKRGYNYKVDIWSLGCVVLEMWAGERPWKREEAMAVIVKLYSSKQAPPVPKGIRLSEEADDFRRLCFEVDPDRRPSASDLRKHPYLRLPDDWTFSGFIGHKPTARELEDAETF
ncbi:kinase-like protein [Vararia minispora EC-137]|uniref:Kinase-like protein n=1 Tax=Vararia minispora EC-137 TaxID=1314806 RepID=A0ACB8QPW1_9AGAM|nr:kinase-like protein [Vararia minispora EC-137]